jgi:mevalonate kinase
MTITATASAPAKIILLGEHAAVYGQPAIAMPISELRAYATVQPHDSLQIVATDLGRVIPLNLSDPTLADDALQQTVRLVSQALGAPPPAVRITLRSDIPLASGLGSGAAVSAAVARALSHAMGHPLDDDRLNALVYEIEKTHHGTPSGIDNTVIVYERPIWFARDHPIEPLTISAPVHLIVANSGSGALTKVAVSDVRALYEAQPHSITPVLQRIGALAHTARVALAAGDVSQLGALMNENHSHLQTLTVSSPALDRLVYAARDHGALGAKLSGGGRGGNMLALVTPDTSAAVQQALVAHGAVSAFQTILRPA